MNVLSVSLGKYIFVIISKTLWSTVPFLLLRRSTLIYSFKRYGRLNEQHKLYSAKNSIDLCVCKWNFKLSRHNPYCKTKIFFKKSLFCKLIIYHYSFLIEHYASYRVACVAWRFCRGTQREYSSKPLKHSIVQRILVFKR